MSTHTPGPWKTGTGEFTDQVFCDDPIGEQGSDWGENFICETAGNKANARLIAAAPELLGALKDLENILSCKPYDKDEQKLLTNARHIIARAEGKEPRP